MSTWYGVFDKNWVICCYYSEPYWFPAIFANPQNAFKNCNEDIGEHVAVVSMRAKKVIYSEKKSPEAKK